MNRPNIIYILADDMGYGDLQANSPQSKIPTPNLDRLAAQGMRFTDSHAASSVCTPSRYAILTGRYAWRSRLKQGIVWEWDGALLEAGRPTVASLLKQHGYATACFGKWHLGWDWPTRDGSHPNDTLPFGQFGKGIDRSACEPNIDYTGRLAGGPVDRGFDHYFGVDVPNFPPYTWFEDDHLAQVPTVPKPDTLYGHAGLMLPGWSLEAMIPEFTRRCTDYIAHRAAAAEPFFIYFPLTSPHSPVVPNEPFKGRSGAGNYGDFVCEVDWVVGQVMDAVERAGVADNTLIIFTSDNGPETQTRDDIGAYNRIRQHDHFSMGDFRGVKLDAFEGGHRTPFVACWPSVIPAGAVCPQPTCLVDFFATCADILQVPTPPHGGEDSVSILPLLRGRLDQPTRPSLVHHSAWGTFALRRGDWVFIDASQGNHKEEPDWYRQMRGYSDHHQPGCLYNLRDDQLERRNCYAAHPDIVRELAAELAAVRAGEQPTGPLRGRYTE